MMISFKISQLRLHFFASLLYIQNLYFIWVKGSTSEEVCIWAGPFRTIVYAVLWILIGKANYMFAFIFLLLPLTPLGPGELKEVLSQHWEDQRLSKASEQPAGTYTVTMELTVLLNLPHFPEEWQLIMDDLLLKLHSLWRCRQAKLAWWFLTIRALKKQQDARESS